MNRIKRGGALLLCLLVLIQICVPSSAADADNSALTYSRAGIVTGSGGRQIGLHTLGGAAAYCLNPDRNWPDEGCTMYSAGSPSYVQGSELTANLVMAAVSAYNLPGEADSYFRKAASVIVRYICRGYIAWDSAEGQAYMTVSSDPEGFTESLNGWEAFTEEITMHDGILSSAMRLRLNRTNNVLDFGSSPAVLAWYESTGTYSAQIPDSTSCLGCLMDTGGKYDLSDVLSGYGRDDGAGAYILFSSSGDNLNVAVSPLGLQKYFTKSGGTYTFTTGTVTADVYSRYWKYSYLPAENFTVYASGDSVQTLLRIDNPNPVANVTFPALTLTYTESDPVDPEAKTGAIRINKESSDGCISGVSFTIKGDVKAEASPVGKSGAISGWTVKAADAGDSCDWLGVAQNGEYTYLVRTKPYSRNASWGTGTKYTVSGLRNALNSWYGTVFPQKLKNAAAYSNAASSGLDYGAEVSVPLRDASAGDTDIVFVPSMGEYIAYLAEYYQYGFGGEMILHDEPLLSTVHANAVKLYNYGTTGIFIWSRSTYYNSIFACCMPALYGYDNYYDERISFQRHYSCIYPEASDVTMNPGRDLLPAMWVRSDRLVWTSEEAGGKTVHVEKSGSTDASGTLTFPELLPGTYTVTENADWTRYGKIEPVTVTVSAGSTTKVRISNTLLKSTGTVTVRKSAEDGIIYNLGFRLTDRSDPSRVYTAKTDSTGTAVFTQIPFGEYICEEEGYARYRKLSRDVTVSSTTPDIVWSARNSVIRGGLTVQKISTLQGAVPDGDATFEGISFDLYAGSDNAAVYEDGEPKLYSKDEKILTLETGSSGSASTGSGVLGPGRYVLRESDTGDSGYEPDSVWKHDFTVSSLEYDTLDGEGNALYICVCGNAPVLHSIEITKKDSITGLSEPFPGASLEGAVFEVVNRCGSPVTVGETMFVTGEVITTVTTDAAGRAETGCILPKGSYGIREVQPPEGYMAAAEEVSVTVSGEDSAVPVIIEEEPFAVTFIKTDASSGIPLEGAEIRFTDLDTDSSWDLTSDAEGRICIALIPGHSYTYRETEAPEGYVADSSIYSFEADSGGEPDIGTEIKNRKKGSAVIRKTDVLTGDPVEGAEICICSMDGTELFRQTTDRLGQIYFDASPHMGSGTESVSFTFKESKAPAGYYLNTDTFTFTVAPDGTVSGTTAMTDVPLGTVAIKKTDTGGVPLPGAKLSVYSSSGTLVGQAATGKTGRIYFRADNAGSYYFVEDQAPSGYIRNTEKHTFSIDRSGTVSGTLSLVNTRQGGGSTGDLSFGAAAGAVSAVLAAAAAALLITDRKRMKGKEKHGRADSNH